MSYYSVIIAAAFTSIITVLIFLGFLYKLQKKQQDLILNAQLLYSDLEELCNKCVTVSDKVVSDIAKEVEKGKKVFSELDSINNKPSFSSEKNKNIIEAYQKGYSFKEISQKYGIGQDQVSMIVQLYKNT